MGGEILVGELLVGWESLTGQGVTDGRGSTGW